MTIRKSGWRDGECVEGKYKGVGCAGGPTRRPPGQMLQPRCMHTPGGQARGWLAWALPLRTPRGAPLPGVALRLAARRSWAIPTIDSLMGPPSSASICCKVFPFFTALATLAAAGGQVGRQKGFAATGGRARRSGGGWLAARSVVLPSPAGKHAPSTPP